MVTQYSHPEGQDGADPLVEIEADRVAGLVAGAGAEPGDVDHQGVACPAQSQVISILQRYLAGTCATEASTTARWSAAVLLPAFPGRSIMASDSPVLSHQAVSG